jgi:hypothetical protein
VIAGLKSSLQMARSGNSHGYFASLTSPVNVNQGLQPTDLALPGISSPGVFQPI